MTLVIKSNLRDFETSFLLWNLTDLLFEIIIFLYLSQFLLDYCVKLFLGYLRILFFPQKVKSGFMYKIPN